MVPLQLSYGTLHNVCCRESKGLIVIFAIYIYLQS